MALENEKPLQGWKAIADYLGCSVKTAQRLESRGLQVRRHEALGVLAYPSELDAWTKTLKTDLPSQETLAPLAPIEPELEGPAPNASPIVSDERVNGVRAEVSSAQKILEWLGMGLRHGTFVGVGAALFAVLTAAVFAPAYGLAILAFSLGAAFVVLSYGRFEDSPTSRAVVALYMTAAMSYISSASTMPEFQVSIVNVAPLMPSTAFLFVMGLKFIPLFFLILVYWVIFGCSGDAGFLARPALEKGYTLLGILFLLAEFLCLGAASGDDRVWRAGLAGRWTLLIGSLIVLAVNVAVWLLGWRCFRRREVITSYRSLFSFCAVAYLVIAISAFFVDREHNRINRYDLDVRWPEAYKVRNPDAIRDFRDPLRRSLKSRIGPQLAALLNDLDFSRALRECTFYKQHSDEPFQLFGRAVMFGYRRQPASDHWQTPFVTIRFPKELADALGFESIGEPK